RTPTPCLSLHDALPIFDGRNIVRAVRTADGWQLGRVDGRQLAGDQPVAELRVSRDGTRVAAVVGGDVVVAGVVEDGDQVTLQRPDRKSTRLNSSHVKIS